MTAIARTITFRNGNSDAVRLPKAISPGSGVEVVIEKVGDVITIRPAQGSMKTLAAKLRALPQPLHPQPRDEEEIPERPGL